MLSQLRKDNPLIICITNDVVKNFTANGLLALGASPAMATEQLEMDEFLKYAGALLINIGSIEAGDIDNMLAAAKYANHHDVPIVLDPVACGASKFRKDFCLKLLETFDIAVIRGNASELQALVGEAHMKGTDADSNLSTENVARNAYQKFKCAIIVTGEVDAICVNGKINLIENGTALLTKVTGGGCLLGAVVASFIYNETKPTLSLLTEAMTTYTVASELAEQGPNGTLPGHFAVNLIDQLYLIQESDVAKNRLVKEV
ncbi:hydroxyethylthiazole kinase [Macrococcoides caseolyticum]|uniref:hydroxyethylthiazole kinase n=1 Tax=Macrococcoides caseolyticum TaxID=69966 RepID=UPI001F307AED|nr:hydroxyethylthiazole kinase [Macrococcus caseolyticus]MCE4957610.1 hydroxyethylthiazole kinase [Macrococcus caseolyticus]